MKISSIMAFTISLIVYLIFVFVSLGEESIINKFQIDSLNKGNYSVVVENWDISYLPKTESEWSLYSKISDFDDVYYVSSEEIVSGDWEINIWKWLFYISINELGKEYKINGNKFSLKNKTPWRIIVDTRVDSEYIVYSFDLVWEFSLMSDSLNEATSFILYPHTIFEFDIAYNEHLDWADLYRIDTLNSISYVYFPAVTRDGTLHTLFAMAIWYNRDKEALDFLNTVLAAKNSKLYKEKYNHLRELDIANSITWAYIEKYFSVFYNKEKKVIYYKNIALNNLHRLFLSWGIEVDKKASLNLLESMNNLRDISYSGYNEMLEILKYYNEVVIKYNDIKLLSLKHELAKTLVLLSWEDKIIDSEKVRINSLYNSFDNQELPDDELFDNLALYILSNHFDKDGNIKPINKENYNDLMWLSYTLTSIFNWKIKLVDDNFIKILEYYFLINSELLDSKLSSEKTKETYLDIYYKLLPKIQKQIRRAYFERDLNHRWLLVKKKFDENTYLVFKDMLTKEEGIVDLLINTWYFDNDISSDIKEIVYDINKMFLAIDSYDEYEKKYDKSLNEIFSVDVVDYWDKSTDEYLNVESFKEYISKFDWVTFHEKYVTVDQENFRYIVNGIPVNSKIMDFIIYPSKDNLITEIKINWEPFQWLYYLDIIEESWETKWKMSYWVSWEENPYDFKKFFYTTFIKEVEDTKLEEYKAEEDILSDRDLNVTEFRFINDKLLSVDAWEFRKINWWLINIEINNVYLEPKEETYDIFIKNAKFNHSSTNWQDTLAEFSSEYEFTKEKHSFSNIELKILDETDDSNKKYKYLWVPLKFIWEISIFDFENEIIDALNIIPVIDTLYYRLKGDIFDELVIEYNLDSLEITISYLSKSWKNVEITLDKERNVAAYILWWVYQAWVWAYYTKFNP